MTRHDGIDPLLAVRRDGAPTRLKRFYETADAEARDGGHLLLLDGKAARTPARHPVLLPTAAAARAVAAEWNLQGAFVDPLTMPMTRIANAAIDGVVRHGNATLEEVKGYFGSDLLYYRAGDPPALATAQAEAWDPVLRDYTREFGVRFRLAEGVMFVAQPPETLKVLARATEARAGADAGAPFRIAALHVATTLTGSALLALALMRGRLSRAAAWAAAHVDEAYQEAHWGVDADAQRRRDQRWRELQAAARLAAAIG